MAIDKNTILKEAQKFVAKGQYDKAIAEWKKLLKVTPDDPNIFNIIGDLCLKKNAKVGAVEAYRKAADLLAADGFTSKAIALYKKVLNIDIKQIEVHLSLGDMNVEKGLIGNALENYKYVADHYTHNKETAKALTIYQKMADLNPSNVAFRVRLGDMYAKEDMNEDAANAYLAAADVHVSKQAFKEARQLFEKVLALNTGSKEVYYKAGVVYFLEGKFSEACKAFKPAFEDDPSNKELASSYIEALEKAGKHVEVEQIILAHLVESPDDDAFREKLYHLYLAQKDYDKAFVEASTLAEAKIKNGDTGAAEEIYRAFVTGCPDFPPGRRKLAEFYLANDRPQDAAAELIQTAELFVNDGDPENARTVLNQVIEIAPELTAAKEQLDRLQTTSAIETSRPLDFVTTNEETEPEPGPKTPEIDTSAADVLQVPESALRTPSADVASISADDDPAIAEAFVEADVLIKYGLAAKAIEQLEALSSKFPESPRIRTRLRDLYQEQGNIDKAVRQALLAVALYTKYGNNDEASAVLQAARELAPDHPAVLSKLGRMAASAADGTIAIAPEAVPPSEIVQEPIEVPVASAEPYPAIPEENLVESAVPQEPTRADEIVFEGLDTELPPLEEISSEEPDESASPAEPSAFVQQPVDEVPPFPELHSMEQPAIGEELVGGPEQADRGTAEELSVPKPQEEIDLDEIWAETEFYFQQGLFDEAKKLYTRILLQTPGDKRAIDRLSEIAREENETREYAKLTDAVEGLEGYVPPEATDEALAASPSDDEAVRSLMQEIHQLKQQPTSLQNQSPVESVDMPFNQEIKTDEELQQSEQYTNERDASPEDIVVSPPEASADNGIVSTVQVDETDKEEFFDLGEELQRETASPAAHQTGKASGDTSDKKDQDAAEDFFDLAAELRDELSSVIVPTRPAQSAEEQSLDDIFEEFKKGVEQQSAKEDADTHYNLGVAYKEMGLLDDAIGELIMTTEVEPKFIQSRYMLGLCYMEKGEYQKAIGEVQTALDYSESLGIDTEHRIAMHYDLGLAFQGAGNIDSAINVFQMVINENPGYRDVAAKLKELRKGDFISLEQLKDDIEKEISSKFLEEGERIEREEKTKKNERVRN
jgi:pilus assembly protein FimV